MEQRKTCEESRLILTDDGQEKRGRLAKAIAEIVESDPEERFVLIDPKRVELEEAKAKLLVLGKRIKEASEVGPLLQKTLDEIQQRRKDGREGMRICLATQRARDMKEFIEELKGEGSHE